MNYKLDIIKLACDRQRILAIWYPNKYSAKPEHRQIDVYAWNEKYIDAYCRKRNGKRTFRIDRIENLELLDEHFEKDWFWEEHVRRFGWATNSEGSLEEPKSPGDFARERREREAQSGRSADLEPTPEITDGGKPATPPVRWSTLFLRILTLGMWG